jgi:tRNA-binding protein
MLETALVERGIPNLPTAEFAAFEALDIRLGRIIKVEEAQTRKPTWRLTIDFGPEVGTKISCGAFRNYTPDFPGRAAGHRRGQLPATAHWGRRSPRCWCSACAAQAARPIFLTSHQPVDIGAAVF